MQCSHFQRGLGLGGCDCENWAMMLRCLACSGACGWLGGGCCRRCLDVFAALFAVICDNLACLLCVPLCSAPPCFGCTSLLPQLLVDDLNDVTSSSSVATMLLRTGTTVVAGASSVVKNDRGDGFAGIAQHPSAAATAAFGVATTAPASNCDVASTVADLHAGIESSDGCAGSAIVARLSSLAVACCCCCG